MMMAMMTMTMMMIPRVTMVTPPPEDGVDHKRPGVSAVAGELRESGEAESEAGPAAHHAAAGGQSGGWTYEQCCFYMFSCHKGSQ